MNQSESEANTCNRREKREIVHKPITFSFVLRFAENKYVYCDWSTSTRTCLFKYKLKKRRQSKNMFTFDKLRQSSVKCSFYFWIINIF